MIFVEAKCFSEINGVPRFKTVVPRVSAVYDVAYNGFRLVGTGLVIPLYDHLGSPRTLACVGLILLLWTPVLPIWVRGTRDEEFTGAT